MFFVPVIAMALCGFWHGSAWHFMLWGILHGIAISIFQYWQRFKLKNALALKISKQKWFDYLSTLVTFSFVTIAWLYFR